MNIFITGGSGFLGTRLLPRLLSEGHSITALSNSASSDTVLQKFGVSTVRGNLDDIATWAPALAGHDVVIHAAAPVLVWGEWKLFYQQITVATQKLYEACAEHGVKRFIFISSESVLQGRGSLLNIDETTPYPSEPNSYYGKAKMLAEKALLHSNLSPTCIILRPTFIWGSHNRGLKTIIQKVRSGKFIWVDNGAASMEMVHVDNVAEAIRLSVHHGENHQIYYVTDDHPMPVREFLTGIFEKVGVTPPNTNLPGWLARPAASLIEFLWHMFHLQSTPPLSRFQLDIVALPRRYDISKIKQDLGYKPVVSYDEGLRDFVE